MGRAGRGDRGGELGEGGGADHVAADDAVNVEEDHLGGHLGYEGSIDSARPSESKRRGLLPALDDLFMDREVIVAMS